ncbi:MAG: hypothetical protein AAB903_00495, partial [Patescibacteria group bacterium]
YKLVAESLLRRDKLREANPLNLQFPTWCGGRIDVRTWEGKWREGIHHLIRWFRKHPDESFGLEKESDRTAA